MIFKLCLAKFTLTSFRTGLRTVACCLTVFSGANAQTNNEKASARVKYLAAQEPTGETIPKLDVVQYCQKQSLNSAQPATRYRECFDNQQKAYDYLKPIWSKLPKQMAQHCLGNMEARSRIPPDYNFLRGCVDRDLDEAIRRAAPPPQREFKY